MAEDLAVTSGRKGMSRTGKSLFALAVVLALLIGLVLIVGRGMERWFGEGPPPEVVVESSLKGLREQNMLVPFSARFVSVATSKQSRLGLSAQKTLIMPGSVRYEVDLSKLTDDSVAWDGTTKSLTVTLPPIRIAGPEVDLRNIREYGEGGILMALTNAEDTLDQANINAARADLLKQAQSGPTMNMAREAAIKAVESNFEVPLRAVGIEATVKAQFADQEK